MSQPDQEGNLLVEKLRIDRAYALRCALAGSGVSSFMDAAGNVTIRNELTGAEVRIEDPGKIVLELSPELP